MNTPRTNAHRAVLAMSGLVLGLFPAPVATNLVASDGAAAVRSALATATEKTNAAATATVVQADSLTDLWTMGFGR